MQKVVLIFIEELHTLLEFFSACVLHYFALIKTHKDESFLVYFLIRVKWKCRGMLLPITYKPWVRQGCGSSIFIPSIFFDQLPFRIRLLESGFGCLLFFQVNEIIFIFGWWSPEASLTDKKFLLDVILLIGYKVVFFIFDEMFCVDFKFKISSHLLFKSLLNLFLVLLWFPDLKLSEVILDQVLGVWFVKCLEYSRLDGVLHWKDHLLMLDHWTF